MKFKTVLLLGALLILLSMVSCTMRSHTEPELTVDNALNLGQAIFLNETAERPTGLGEIHINEGDTLKLQISSALLKTPSYTWTPADNNVVKFVKDDADPTIFYAVALADSGVSTTVELQDVGNLAKKSFDVIIEKHWADPDLFKFIGSFGGHYYYISLIQRTWVQAEMICREAGGYLAAISSAEENTFLFEGRGREENVWIGVRFTKEDDKWVVSHWSNGEPIDFKNFGDSTSSPGIFMEVYWYMGATGSWISWHEISYPFFLELE